MTNQPDHKQPVDAPQPEGTVGPLPAPSAVRPAAVVPAATAKSSPAPQGRGVASATSVGAAAPTAAAARPVAQAGYGSASTTAARAAATTATAGTASAKRSPADAKAAPQSSPDATPQGEKLPGSHAATWQAIGREMLRESPAWLTSMVFHIVVLLMLGLWLMPEVTKEVRNLIATAMEDKEEDKLDEIKVDNPVDNLKEEIAASAFSEPVETDNVAEAVEISPLDEAPAPSMSVNLSPIGIETAPMNDLMSQVGSIGGRGLEGRGEAARRALVAKGGGNAGSEAAVALALVWLSQHQNPDGSWSFDHTKGACQGRCPNPGNIQDGNLAATGLALLPFLGAGQTHREGKYQRLVQNGLYYLTSHMKVDANGGSLMDEGMLYGHGICSMALCEAYGMTQDRGLMVPAQQAINFIVYAQDKVGGGWRYVPGQPGDTSVVGWQLMALKSADMAYLNVPPQTVAGLSNFLNSVQSDSGAAYGYMTPGATMGTSAIGLLCRMYLGWEHDHPALERGVERLSATGPSEGNVYYNYYATQVLHHYEGPLWEKWNKIMRDYYVNTQSKNGHEAGSWFFKGADHGAERGGRLYMTALCCMTLEVYYRHLPIYRKEALQDDFE